MKPTQPNYKKILAPTKPRKHWYSTLNTVSLIAVFIIGGLIWVYFFTSIKAYKIPTGSMKSTLLIGDHIITHSFFADEKPNRRDIIIFPLPIDKKKDFIKRVVGLPGEKLEIRQQQVYINNNALSEPYAMHTEPSTPKSSPRDDLSPMKIPDGYIFVLGDNRENSFDSRHFGAVEIKDVARKVKWIYWSWNYEDKSVRWDRIGSSVE